MAQALEIDDFSGGVTDYFLATANNKMSAADNLLLFLHQGKAKPFTRPGSNLLDEAYPQIPPGSQRIATAFYINNELFVQSGARLYRYEAGTGWVHTKGPLSTENDAFYLSDITTTFTYGRWNNHVYIAHSGQYIPQKLVQLTGGDFQVRQVGLPKPDETTVVVNSASAGAGNSYLYKFVYTSSYTDVNGVEFLDVSAPSESVQFEQTVVIGPGNDVTIDGSASFIANGANDNYDEANIKIAVYRTTKDGSTFYKVADLTTGVTAHFDDTIDEDLTTNELLYTTGGTVPNDQPPKSTIVHTLLDRAYYAGILDASDNPIPQRLYQSVQGNLDAVPAFFYVDLDDAIVGVSSSRNKVLAICKNNVYRIDGLFDSIGRGGMVADRISDTATCVSAQSVVQTLDGCFWAGADGIYFSDGYKVLKLNEDYDVTWNTFVKGANDAETAQKKARIQGKYDRKRRRIWWTIQATSSDDVDSCYVLDLTYGVRANSTFTTISGLASFSPTAIEFDENGDMIRCDRRGYVLKHDSLTKSDPKIDILVTPADWSRQTIFYTLATAAYNFGLTSVRKMVTRCTVTAESETNLSLQVVSINDNGRKEANLAPIRYRGNIVWGAPDIYWGDSVLEWNKQGFIDEQRRFPANNIRCNYKQIRLENAKLAIISSDKIGTADINAVTKTVNLNNAVNTDWPTNSIDYFIAFEADGYIEEYLITGRTDDTLTYADPAVRSTTATSSGWILRGYPKNEILNLVSFTLHYEVFGRTQGVFTTAGSGEVGT